jgi:Tol biopolymer transport system component
MEAANFDLYLVDAARGVQRRVTFGTALDEYPIWSPAGDQIVFGSSRTGGVLSLWLMPINGSPEQQIFASGKIARPTDWSLDGRHILFNNGLDIWVLPVADPAKAYLLVQAQPNRRVSLARFSPDSRWIVYQSDETGQPEIYARLVNGGGPAVRVSAKGGDWAFWRGRETFYETPARQLTAVPVDISPDNQSLTTGAPVSLFTVPPGNNYEVAHDGQRILVANPVDQQQTPPISLIFNWKPPAR